MEEDAERTAAEKVQSDVDAKCKDAEIKRKDAEIKRKDAEIAAYKELLKKAGIEVERLRASEAYHDGAHVPTSKGSLTMRQMQKEIVDERRAASTGRRPGRERATRGPRQRSAPDAPVEHRYCGATRCPHCGGRTCAK